MMNLSVVIKSIAKERDRVKADLERLEGALSALGSHTKKSTGKRVLSQGARDRIAEAQRARWAKFHKQGKKQSSPKLLTAHTRKGWWTGMSKAAIRREMKRRGMLKGKKSK